MPNGWWQMVKYIKKELCLITKFTDFYHRRDTWITRNSWPYWLFWESFGSLKRMKKTLLNLTRFFRILPQATNLWLHKTMFIHRIQILKCLRLEILFITFLLFGFKVMINIINSTRSTRKINTASCTPTFELIIWNWTLEF